MHVYFCLFVMFVRLEPNIGYGFTHKKLMKKKDCIELPTFDINDSTVEEVSLIKHLFRLL